jgi:hypothetical protein
MVMTMETVVHIPPPDQDEPPSQPGWIVLSISVAAIAGVVVLVTQTRPGAPAYEWSSSNGPPRPVILDSLVALEDGFAILSGITPDGVVLWMSDGSGRWDSQSLEGTPTQLTTDDSRLAAYRGRSGAVYGREGGSWVVAFDLRLPAETRSRQASGRAGLMLALGGVLEMSLFGDVWWSSDGQDFNQAVEDPAWGHGVEQPFTSACRPPSRSSPDVPPIVVQDDGMVALVSSNPDEPFGIWPVCEPVLWTSEDGDVWSSESTSLFGEGAYVYDVAGGDDRLVAVGGRGIDSPAVWTTTNGREWTDVTPPTGQSVDLYRVEAGGAGWVILGRDSLQSTSVGWTSRDGECWEPLAPRVGGSEAVVSDEAILVVDRTAFPQMWLATPTGSSGVCP